MPIPLAATGRHDERPIIPLTGQMPSNAPNGIGAVLTPVAGQARPVAGQTISATEQSSPDAGQPSPETGQTITVAGQPSPEAGQTITVAGQSSRVAGQTSQVTGQPSVAGTTNPVRKRVSFGLGAK